MPVESQPLPGTAYSMRDYVMSGLMPNSTVQTNPTQAFGIRTFLNDVDRHLAHTHLIPIEYRMYLSLYQVVNLTAARHAEAAAYLRTGYHELISNWRTVANAAWVEPIDLGLIRDQLRLSVAVIRPTTRTCCGGRGRARHFLWRG